MTYRVTFTKVIVQPVPSCHKHSQPITTELNPIHEEGVVVFGTEFSRAIIDMYNIPLAGNCGFCVEDGEIFFRC